MGPFFVADADHYSLSGHVLFGKANIFANKHAQLHCWCCMIQKEKFTIIIILITLTL